MCPYKQKICHEKYIKKKLAMEINTENFGVNKISLNLNKVGLTKKLCHGVPFTWAKSVSPVTLTRTLSMLRLQQIVHCQSLFDKDLRLHFSVTNNLLHVNAKCFANFLCYAVFFRL